MEDLQTKQFIILKTRWKYIFSLTSILLLFPFLVYLIVVDFNSDGSGFLLRLLQKLLFTILFILWVRYAIKNYIIHLKDGVFKVATGHQEIFKFKIDDVKYIDRHFDEWTIFLKNGKKKTFSDAHIPKEQKSEFKELMNLFPKVHPQVQL